MNHVFRTSFPVPSLKHLSARFFAPSGSYKILAAAARLIFIWWYKSHFNMLHSSRDIVVLDSCISESGSAVFSWTRPAKMQKSNCNSRTTQRIKAQLVPLYWRGRVHSNDTSIVGLMCSWGCPQWKTYMKIYYPVIERGPTQQSATPFSTQGSYSNKYQAYRSRVLLVQKSC